MINRKIPHDFGTTVSQWLGLDLWTFVNIYGKYNGNTMKYNSMKHHEILSRVKNCPSSKCMVCIVLSILDTVALWTPSNPWLLYHVVPQYPHSIPWYSQYSHFFMGLFFHGFCPIFWCSNYFFVSESPCWILQLSCRLSMWNAEEPTWVMTIAISKKDRSW
jgi:hypothetical protein